MAELPYSNGNGMNGDAPHVTTGSMWRSARETGFVKQLPSGNWARLRPVGLERLITGGEIPDLLTPLVTKMFLDGADSVDLDTFLAQRGPEKTLAQMGEMIALLDAVCKAAFVEPRIVDNPQAEDEIGIEDLDLQDKSFVFHLVQQPVAVLRRFRLEPSADVAAVPDGQQVEPAAQQPRRGKRRVGSAATG